MRAVQISRTGGPEVLELVDLPVPEPGPGQARVRHEAIGLNFIDTYRRSGLYKVPLPAVLAGEAAGVVEAVVTGVSDVKVGDRVAFIGAEAYAEASVQPAARLVILPDGVDARIAAGSLLKGMTAEFLLRRLRPLKPGEYVLVHAAAGGVGQLLVQWGRALGLRVIATAGGEEKLAVAKRLGAEHGIDYRTEDVAARVRELTGGQGVSVVYDGVGAATFEASLNSLKKRGLLVSYGNASGPAPAIPPLRLSQAGSAFLTRPTLYDYIDTREELTDSARALFDRILAGDVTVNIGAEYPLAQAADAHRALEARETVGSTLLIP